MTWTPGPWTNQNLRKLMENDDNVMLMALAPEMAECLEDWLIHMEPQDEEVQLERTEALLARARGEA